MNWKKEIELPEVMSAGGVERALSEYGRSVLSETTELIVSFRNVNWIEAPSLVLIAALSLGRSKIGVDQKFRTTFRAPAKDNAKWFDVLSTLHEFGFFELVAQLTDVEVMDLFEEPMNFAPFWLVETSDSGTSQVISNPKIRPKIRDLFRRFYHDDEALKALHFGSGFFRLRLWPFRSQEEKLNTLRTLPSMWGGQSLIVSVLEKRLAFESSAPISLKNKLANDVVLECVTNAIRHPNAERLVSVSSYDGKGSKYTIVIWDDGKSIVESLYDAFEKTGQIRNSRGVAAVSLLDLTPSFYIAQGDEFEPGKSIDQITLRNRFYLADELPINLESDAGFLVAAFFPGVSRNSTGLSDVDSLELEEDLRAKAAYSGLGLTVLLEAVVGLLGGVVSVRVKDRFARFERLKQRISDGLYRQLKEQVYFSNLESRYEKDRIDKTVLKRTSSVYSVTVSDRSFGVPLPGTMLTIEIPLRKK